MPEISRFFGIIIRMFYDEHDPPHFHAEYSGHKALFDFNGNIIKGSLESRTATLSKEVLNQERQQNLFVNGLISTPLNLMQHGRWQEVARKFWKLSRCAERKNHVGYE